MFNSTTTFERYSTVKFNYNNHGNVTGKAACIDFSIVTFEENSTVMFNNNIADNGGHCIFWKLYHHI